MPGDLIAPPYDRRWLLDQADGLLGFFETESLDPTAASSTSTTPGGRTPGRRFARST